MVAKPKISNCLSELKLASFGILMNDGRWEDIFPYWEV